MNLVRPRQGDGRLTSKQESFARGVAEGRTQSDAYRAAYRSGGMTAKQVHEEACKLAARPKVGQRIAALRAEAAERSVLKIMDVLEETRRLMLVTPANLIDKQTGKVKLPHELDADTAAAVASFEIDDLGRIKYRFWDKNSALERAAKILGLLRDGPTIVNNGMMNITKIELVALEPLEAPPAADVVDLVEMEPDAED